MADFNVQVKIDPTDAKRGGKAVRRELNSTETAADRMRTAINRALTFAGITVAARQLIQLTDTFTNLQNRLRTVVSGQTELASQTEKLFQVAQRTRSSYEGTIELYARVGLAAKELGRTQKELTDFTESLNQAIILSGASGEEAQAGLIQLSQGLASGALRGDELRSVLEQLPAVADVIAKQLGVTRGELRTMGAEGKITADIVLDAFKNAREELETRFAKTVPTISQAFQVFKNSLISVVGGFDQILGSSGGFARVLIVLSENTEILVRSAAALALTLGTILAARAIPAAIGAIRALTVAMAANPIGAIAVALSATISLLVTFSDKIKIARDSAATLGAVLGVLWERQVEGMRIVMAELRGLVSGLLDFARIPADLEFSLSGVLRGIARFVDYNVAFWTGLYHAVVDTFKVLPLVVKRATLTAMNALVQIIENKIHDLITRSNELLSSIGAKVQIKDIGFTILDPGEAATKAKKLGETVMDGFAKGLDNMFLENWVTDVIGEAEAAAKRRGGPVVEGSVVSPALRTAPTAEQTAALEAQKKLFEQIKAPIEEYKTTLAAANALLEQGKISLNEYNAALQQTQLGGELQQLQLDLMPEQDAQLTMLEQSLQQRLDLVKQFHEARLISEQEALSMSLEINKQHNAEVESIELARYKTQLSAGTRTFSALADIAKGYAGEQSKTYRTLFAISKAFAIAETTVAIAQGIANAAKLGYPANIPAIAGVIAQTAGLVGQIQSAQFSGSYQTGGSFKVGGSGGADSQLVAFRATPNETVSVRTPSQQRSAETAQAAPASESQSIRIVNVTDPGLLEDYLTSPAGEKTLVNAINRNQGQIRQIMR